MNELKNRRFGSAVILACRMSGEMNTSLGNGISNLLLNLFVLANCGCKNVTGIVEGDDGLFRFYGPEVTAQHFATIGFTIKISVADAVNEASFCGIIYDGLDGLNVTNPISGLMEFGWGGSRYAPSSENTRKKLLRSKALSLLYSYPGCPILQSLALYALRITEGMRYLVPSNFSLYEKEEMRMCLDYIKEHGLPVRDVPERTRLLVEKLYGIPVSVQLSVELKLDTLTELVPLDFPELLPYCKPDQLHYYSLYCYKIRSPIDLVLPRNLVKTVPLKFKRGQSEWKKYFQT